MAVKTKNTKRSDSMFRSCGIGVAIAIILSIVIALITGFMIVNGTIGDNTSETIATFAQLISVAVGALIAGKLVTEKKILSCAITSAVYYFVLVAITIMFFEGAFNRILISAAAGMIGCGLAVFGNMKRSKRRSYRR